MDKTKQAINNFVSKSGQHETTVHESVNPAVQHETVIPQKHEEINTAVDKEVHQDHYHHTVQPVQDKEVLDTQHHHKVAEAEHRTFDNRDDSKVKAHLEREAAKFKNESVRTETAHTQSNAPVVQGEHVHHHVHETYQPVIHKETVEPHVVHTTIPVHETHHNEAKHHATSTLPAVSLSEFKQHGGTHTGGQHEQHRFEGCPEVEGGAHTHNKGFSSTTGTTGTTTGASTGRSAVGAGSSSTTGNYGHTTGAQGTAGVGAVGGRGTGSSYDSTPRTTGTTDSSSTGHDDSSSHENKGLISKVMDKVNSARS